MTNIMANTTSFGNNRTPVIQEVKKPPVPSTSWSYTDSEPDTVYDHAWSIANFNRKMRMKPGMELRSTVWSCTTKKDYQLNWVMRINPNGEEKDHEGYVSLFLYKEGNCRIPVEAEITFSIIGKDGIKMRSRRCKYTFEKNVPRDNRGFCMLVSHDDLRHPHMNFLPNDTLTILCEISILGNNIVTSGTNGSAARVMDPMLRLQSDILSLFEQSKKTDCTIVCEGKEFRCHKNILASRSSVFDAIFTRDMEEDNDSKVDIVDLDSDTVYNMIVYIYSGEVTEIEDKAINLLPAADKYDLKDLKTMCESVLCDTVTHDNVLDILVLANIHGANTLRDMALKFIVNNGKAIVCQEGWRDKLKAYPEIMADMFEAVAQETRQTRDKRQKVWRQWLTE